MIRRMQIIFQKGRNITVEDAKREQQKPDSILQNQSIDENMDIDHQYEKRKFETLAGEAPRPILQIRSIFPLDFFPDTLIVDSAKVTQIHRIFFGSEEIKSIMIKDIKNVIIESSPFFAVLRIADIMFQPTTLEVRPLWKKDALKARNIIQGLAISTKQQVDITKIEAQKEIQQIQHLGEPSEKV